MRAVSLFYILYMITDPALWRDGKREYRVCTGRCRMKLPKNTDFDITSLTAVPAGSIIIIIPYIAGHRIAGFMKMSRTELVLLSQKLRRS